MDKVKRPDCDAEAERRETKPSLIEFAGLVEALVREIRTGGMIRIAVDPAEMFELDSADRPKWMTNLEMVTQRTTLESVFVTELFSLGREDGFEIERFAEMLDFVPFIVPWTGGQRPGAGLAVIFVPKVSLFSLSISEAEPSPSSSPDF